MSVDSGNPMHKFLFWALVIGHAVGGIAITLGAAYAWLWLAVLAVKVFGLAVGSVVVVASFLGLVRLLHSGGAPLFGWYQPWDHGYWMIAERIGSHCWQRSANGGAC